MIIDEDQFLVECWFLPGKAHKDGGRVGFLVQVWKYRSFYRGFDTVGCFQKVLEIERRGEKIHHRPLDDPWHYANYQDQSIEAARLWAEKSARRRVAKWKDGLDLPLERTLIYYGGVWFPQPIA
jgi:hypothetical protein